ncbi:HTH domain-containing protein [Curtobacterium flaccumfaciens]|uniref:HTH domain-containing protein n=1 Tax=Curtobacterium flaccumfaciens TaxID=2035 RepID=UPI0039966AB7
MSTEAYDVDQGLRHLVKSGRMSTESLSAITGIATTTLQGHLAGDNEPGMTAPTSALTGSQGTQLAMLAVLLTDGLNEDDDVRLRALVESLTLQYKLTHENIALLIDADAADIAAIADDAAQVDAGKKYRLGVRLSYLLTAIGNAERLSS